MTAAPTWFALTLEIVDGIYTSSTISAGLSATVIHVGLTEFSQEARHTATHVRVDAVDAGASVKTRPMRTVVYVSFAAWASVAHGTHALEPIVLVHT